VITAKEANKNPFAGYSASLAQGLGHIASTRPSLGLPNNSGLLRGNPRQWRILPLPLGADADGVRYDPISGPYLKPR
jgi:hypothetical protein